MCQQGKSHANRYQVQYKLTVHRSDLNVRTESVSDNFSTTQDMSSIARGPFAVPIRMPQQQSSACLSRTNESVAWQCASDTTFQLNILPSPMYSNITMITLGSATSMNGTLYHGHQAPNVAPVELRAVSTSPPGNHNSVYHFRTSYDRIVLLKQNDLSPSDNPRAQPAMRHPTFETDETLWRCVWNDTMIEGYIYSAQRSTITTMSNSTAPAMVQQLPKMPYSLKIVEQRVPEGRQPYCEKVRIGEQGLEGVGSRESVLLRVAEMGEAGVKNRDVRMRFRQRMRRQVMDGGGSASCRCQWMVQ
jgi:hypothetical protein